MTCWLVAGAAGVGKSTVGLALAAQRSAVLLDLDELTNPLLDALAPAWPASGHWNDDGHRLVVRPARYRVLLDVARSQVGLGHDVVLVAPFTAELAGGPDWDALVEALGEAPLVLWLAADAQVLERRTRERGEARDVGHAPAAAHPPVVPHEPIDATGPLPDVLDQVLRATLS